MDFEKNSIKTKFFKGGVNRYIELKTEVYLYNYSTILSNFLKNKSFNDVNSKTINIHKIKLHNMFLLTLHFIEIFGQWFANTPLFERITF